MRLIINADDFGLTKSITDGIVDGIKAGVVTSTSLMVTMEAAEYAINKALENNIDCVGLHINFTKGKPIIPNEHITDENGEFLHRSIQLTNPNLTYEDAYNEIQAQLKKVDELSNGKLKIDHLDTHHFACSNENIRKAKIAIAKERNIPIRNEFECDVVRPDVFNTDFSLVDVTYEKLESIINEYKDKDISMELMVHPGYMDEHTMSLTSYNTEREKELEILKQAKENGLFDGIELISFHEL
ncbi:MAG: ChbG/HpnK family deacetylase [Bacilli bacterium]|nr:ChbG/HpnK family deacetylase [Bacilli bacterium]